MPQSRRLSSTSQEAFGEYCKENPPKSRRPSIGGDGDDAASVGSRSKLAPRNSLLLKKRRLSTSHVASNKKRSQQPLRLSVPTGRFSAKPKKSTTTTFEIKVPRPIIRPNMEKARDGGDAVCSPTQASYYSPPLTRSAKKRKTGDSSSTDNTTAVDMAKGKGKGKVLIFSPPNQALNTKRRKEELERKTNERNQKIANNRQQGMQLVFNKDLECVTRLPPDDEQEYSTDDAKKEEHAGQEHPNDDAKGEEHDVPDDVTEVAKKEPEDPPSAADREQSFSSVSAMDDDCHSQMERHERPPRSICSGSSTHEFLPEEGKNQIVSALNTLNDKFTTLNRRMSEMPSDRDTFVREAQKQEIDDLTKAKSRLEQRNNKLSSELKELEAKLKIEQDSFLAGKERMQEEVDQLKSLQEDLEQAFHDTQEKSDMFENELLPESEAQLQQALEKLQEFEEQLEESSHKIDEYKQVVESLKKEKEDLALKLSEEQNRVTSLTRDTEKAYHEERQASQAKDAKIENLETSLVALKQALKEQQSFTSDKTEELQDVIAQVKAANDEKEQLRLRLESAMSQINHDSEIKNKKSAALQSVNEQNDYLQKRLKELEAQLKKSQTERDDAILRLGTSDQREHELFDKLRESDRIRKEMHARLMVLIGSIRTFVRVRPALPGERDNGEIKDEIFKFSGSNGSSEGSKSSKYGCDDPTKNLVSVQEPWKDRGGLSQRQKKWTFGFDQVFTPQTSQEDVWEATEPLVQSAVDGFNVTVFAYGQTGSGKTYTMLGNGDAAPGDEGIIARAIRKLFNSKQEIEELSQGLKSVSMKVEMLEIYNEQVRDLLASPSGADGPDTSLKVVGSEAVGSIRQDVKTEAEVFKILKTAEKRRCVKATNSNATSSRSHLVFSIEYIVASKDGSKNQTGKLNVCDLAGSERVSKSGATGSILKEAQHINLSLSTLSNVIEKLQAGDKNVPFRDSKLTSLLQNSLEGNSKTLCIVCCSPLQDHFHETLTSLRFAAKIGRVDLKAVQNFSA